jgi:HMG-box domain
MHRGFQSQLNNFRANKSEFESVSFRSIENMQGQDGDKKKMKRFRYADIGSVSLRGITKKIESNMVVDHELKEKAATQLNDWINRRVTGYLIFQNTMTHNSVEHGEKDNLKGMGVHQNNVMGQKWKNLNEEYRDEYRNLAKEYRKILRKEIEAYENYDDITELIELFDQKIKKIRKE